MASRYILGVSAFYHDSAAALIRDGEILFAAHEERFTRKKHDPEFPVNAVKAALEHVSREEGRPFGVRDLDAVVFYDKPFLKLERLLETYYAFAPKGLRQFLSAVPVWAKEKMFLKKTIFEALAGIDPGAPKPRLLFTEHHLAHAASAFYPSPYEEAAVLTIDGVGEWATASICRGSGNRLKILKELRFPHSLGLLYSAFTYYTGFKVNSGEYKLMGLAPYGDPDSDRVKKFRELISTRLVNIKEDGSLWLNQEYFDYAAGLRMTDDRKFTELFGLPPRAPETDPEQPYCDMALAIQQVTEEAVLKMASHARELTGAKRLCLAGGVALNCVANGKLLTSGLFEDIWIQPAAGDAGGALGAALAAEHLYFSGGRRPAAASPRTDRMRGSYLGPEYSDAEIESALRPFGAVWEKLEDAELFERAASLIAEGKVVGWFQGRMEWGPRALGNRSILGDARNPDMQKKLNLKIKYREGFRPFAPSALIEDSGAFFENGISSPYMLLIDYVRTGRRRPLPEGYHSRPLKEKLYFQRSDIPAVTHLDYSARLQTVHKDTNPRYHALISAFKKLTGYGLIVNTSFNVRGEPIVMSPADAYRCFMGTEMDCLAAGNLLMYKEKQPASAREKDWSGRHGLD
ncbi:MAG TPA: carbamoyltransferase [Elusimicrobiales bacterium]|nr:carbamoyltransferase [Elusimicrobiales bacterium]